MTAYVNDEQKKEGAYGKAVKATLAATLPAGMVPAAAAFAEKGQAEAASEGGVERLSVFPRERIQGRQGHRCRGQRGQRHRRPCQGRLRCRRRGSLRHADRVHPLQ